MIISIYEYPPVLFFCAAVALIFGAVMGSFLNCAAWRIAHGESFLKGRSRCPRCGHVLTPPELVPVFSWLLQGGRCRACGEKISVRYPLTELGFALTTLVCLLRFDLTALCLRNYVFLCCLFCLSLVDLECFIIPDGCCLTAAAAWLLFILSALILPGAAGLKAAEAGAAENGADLLSGSLSVVLSEAVPGLAAAVLFGGGVLAVSLIMDHVLGRDSLGGGDIKLIAVTGLYLKPVGTLFAVMLACILGLLFFVVRNGLPEKDSEKNDTGEGDGGDREDIRKGQSTGSEEDGAGGESGGSAQSGESGGSSQSGERDGSSQSGESDGSDGDIPDKAFPFGPSIALAAAVMLLFGEPLVGWYLGLMGI